MATFTKQIRIDASPAEVWATLGDVGTIAEWNPGLIGSHPTTEENGGLGASRHCDVDGKQFIDETVVEWEPERTLTMRVTDTNLPLASADIRFELAGDADGTSVMVRPDYAIKLGPIGKLMDALFVRRTYERGMEALLGGLKRHVEGRIGAPAAALSS
ncbi:MAG: SRPBCC family protein [Gemmatimonadetes bacterium]|nr:SRPBCC family protein [Gemmatimonadota bacterium]